MPAYETIVYLDISTPQGAFVGGLESFQATPPDIGPFIQGQAITFHVHPVGPIPPTEANPNPGYKHVGLAGLNFELVIGPRAGAGTVGLCSLDGGNWMATDGTYWAGTIDLNTSAMNTAIGTADTLNTYLEFRIKQAALSDAYKPVAQIAIVVIASVRDPNAVASPTTPDPTYLTVGQGNVLYVKWNNMNDANNFGRSVIFASPSGLRGRGLGVDDDGSPIDYSI
jgi:hypothetical protein